MITRSKLIHLEEKLVRVNRKNHSGVLWRDIAEDGRLIDGQGYIMTDEEVAITKYEDKVAQQQGYKIFCLTDLSDPKIKDGSSVAPYLTRYKPSKSRQTN